MITIDRIKQIAQRAYGNKAILSDIMLEEIMPKIFEAIEKQHRLIGYGITYHRPASEYPEVFYTLLWKTTIRQTVLEYLEENHPLAWFKPMYYPDSQLQEFMEKNNLQGQIAPKSPI